MQILSLSVGAFIAAAPMVHAGNAIVRNLCKFDVHLWSVDADFTSQPHILHQGDNYTEPYRTPSVGGVSIKLSNDANCADPITQFEYTLKGPVWYDISNVNCVGNACPFVAQGMHLQPGQGCQTRTCQPGEAPCSQAYTLFNDDWNSLACDAAQDLTLFLCATSPNQPSKRSVEAPETEYGVPARRRHARRHSHAHAHL